MSQKAVEEDPSPPPFVSVDVHQLPFLSGEVHEDVVKYFATCVPEEDLEIWIYHFLTRENLSEPNEDAYGEEMARAGFAVFAVDYSGCVMALDVKDGRCYNLSPFGEYPDKPNLRGEFLANSLRSYDSADDFLSTMLTELAEQIEEDSELEEAFEEASRINPNARDDDGHRKLDRCIMSEDLDGVRREVKRGVTIKHQLREDRDPIKNAVESCDETAILEFLISKGAPVHPQSLVWAGVMMAYDHIDVLLAAGANPELLSAEDREELLEDEDVVERLDRFFGAK